MAWSQISDILYRFEDTCAVYCLKKNSKALLIDCGSGTIADHLYEIGIEKIEWVLHTHHHRDQCWGTNRIRLLGARVAVPEYEEYLFNKVELFWQSKKIYDNYNSRSTFFSVTENIPVDQLLKDYETFSWEGITFQILPAKGHTYGSIMLITELQGKRIAFTGDLFKAGGLLYQYHSLEYAYGDRIGGLFTLQSLQALRKVKPEIALPSHGPIIERPIEDCKTLEDRLLELARLGCGSEFLGSFSNPEDYRQLPDPKMIGLSRHLLWGGLQTCSNFYVILSESGKACFVDYGHSFFAHMHTGEDSEPFDTMRFVVHHLDELRDIYGVHTIDLVLVTHIHDDHIAGIPYLQRHKGTRVWALNRVAQVIEDPAGWCSTPCTLSKPIYIDRKLSDGEHFSWEEYDFEVYNAPGQTEFHSVLVADIDGVKIAFTGDNIMEAEAPGRSGKWEKSVYQTTVLRNSFQLSMHRKCVEVMDRIQPQLVCPGHFRVIEWNPLIAAEYRSYIHQQEKIVRNLVAEPNDHYVDLFWARILPYLSKCSPGEKLRFRVLLRNNLGRKVHYDVRLLPPPEWPPSEEAFKGIDLAPESSGEIELTLEAANHKVVRRPVTAEIMIDGISQGPVTEALVTVV